MHRDAISGNIESTVFIVDDDSIVCNSISMLLKSKNIHTEIYTSAENFLAHYSSGRSGCLLLDVNMPGLDGLSLQKVAQDYGIDIPIILITGYADVAMATESLRTGAFDFIEKPFNGKLLLERVQAALQLDEQTRGQRKLYRQIARQIELLSKREFEVMQLIVISLPTSQSCRTLELTPAASHVEIPLTSNELIQERSG